MYCGWESFESEKQGVTDLPAIKQKVYQSQHLSERTTVHMPGYQVHLQYP